MPSWVLRETFASRQRGVPVYFETWTPIGPAATQNLEDAARFASERAAMASPAYVHFLSFFEPEQLPEEEGA